MMKKEYRIFESLWIASVLTFISGYINAFTFVTQNGRFAGIQSGNLLSLAYYFSLGNRVEAFNFFIPIFFFVLGQWFTYQIEIRYKETKLGWHFISSLWMTCLLIVDTFLTPFISAQVTIAILAFVSSMQIETFKRLQGHPYANVMMTGNVKNAAYLWYKGIKEKDPLLQKKGKNIFLTILSFMIGVVLGTRFSFILGEYALTLVLFPMVFINLHLWHEKNPRQKV